MKAQEAAEISAKNKQESTAMILYPEIKDTIALMAHSGVNMALFDINRFSAAAIDKLTSEGYMVSLSDSQVKINW